MLRAGEGAYLRGCRPAAPRPGPASRPPNRIPPPPHSRVGSHGVGPVLGGAGLRPAQAPRLPRPACTPDPALAAMLTAGLDGAETRPGSWSAPRCSTGALALGTLPKPGAGGVGSCCARRPKGAAHILLGAHDRQRAAVR